MERSSLNLPGQLLLGAVALVAAACLPLASPGATAMNIAILTLLFAGLSQAWNILGGYCGQVSLGHAVYFGIGAYGSTLLATRLGGSAWLGMAAGGAAAGIIAMLLGWPLFRLKGHYYVIATIVVGEAALLLAQSWTWIGATLGIYIPFEGDSWSDLQFQTAKLPFYLVALGYVALLWTVTLLLDRGRLGHQWRAIKDNPEAARSLGVRIVSAKLAAAGLSGGFTGTGGAFYAHYVSYIDPESVMNFQLSLMITLPAVLGGLGTLWGPVVGALVLIPLSELSRSYLGGTGQGVDLIVYGTLITGMSLLRPEGLTGLARALGRKAAARRRVPAVCEEGAR